MEGAMDKKRVWLYCRIAHEAPENEWCMKAQLASLESYAASGNLQIVGTTCEYGAGTTLDRQGLRDMSEAVKAGRIDAILVKNLSRLARGCQEAAQYIHFLNQHSTTLISVDDGLELSQLLTLNTEHLASL